jgi:hypothetical protein
MADWQKAFQPSVALMADWQKAFQPSAPLMAELAEDFAILRRGGGAVAEVVCRANEGVAKASTRVTAATRQTHHPSSEVESASGQSSVRLTRELMG